MNRFLAAMVGAALAAAPGCGSETSAKWKDKFFPQPTAVYLVRIESDRADERREGLERVAADAGARRLPSVVKLFCVVARNDGDAMVRAAAVRGLAVMAGEDVVPTLGHVATHDESPFVRTDACRALGRQAAAGAVAPLAEVLRGDGLADVRVAAAEALRQFRDKAAAGALVGALGDSSLAVSRKAWESLRHMTGQDLPRQARPWEELLAQADNPFLGYGRPPPMPKGENQRPQFTKGPAEFIRGLFARDVREAELE
ncbi:MAG: HEAT repeat domain-containing protein [Planctomycetes bacterium]|nr:HEAT repeat domain-containing protein [Planctomycetota bacterium]